MTCACERCGKPRNKWATRYCSTACEIAGRTKNPAERFWPKVEKTQGCWFWRGYIRPSGYGEFHLRGRGMLANRVAYELATGKIPPAGVDVCHKCDVPACVNPDHLFLGTRAENVRDMMQKGRGRYLRGDASSARQHPERLRRGETSGMAKLNDYIVRAIRVAHLQGATILGMSKQFGVARTTIRSVVYRQSWKHVD